MTTTTSILGQKRRIDDQEDNHCDENEDNKNNDDKQLEKKYKVNVNKFTLLSKNSSKFISNEDITITGFNGKRIYHTLKIEEEEKDYYSEESVRERIALNRVRGTLLGKSIADLDSEIHDNEIQRQIIANSKSTTATSAISASSANDGSKQNKTIDNRLWVDKYAPDSFHELLSDDKMNKDILYWLKQWDYSVFSKPLPKTAASASKQAAQSNHYQQKSKFNNNTTNNNNNVYFVNNNGLDQTNKPIHKIILLTGGPGLGKTTLAHILAKQAGYDPYEINASDDRSGENFENRFLSALEMQSVFKDQKPRCLIIDEIDGISGRDSGPIELILRLIANSKKAGAAKSDKDEDDDDDNFGEYDDMDGEQTTKAKKKKDKSGKSKQPLPKINRPIICICNDQYVPSLRKLRQEALLFNFEKPRTTRLISRLKEICQREGLKADDSALTMLVNMTGHDIRSCLNTLQFIKSKSAVLSSSVLKEKSIDSLIGQKDMEKGLYELWRSIFQSRPSRSSSDRAKEHEEYNSLESEISTCSQLDKLIDGVYENYNLNMLNDFSFEKTVDCLEWFTFSDIISDDKFRSLTPLAIHNRCTSLQPKIVHPNSSYENFVKYKHSISTIESFVQSETVPAVVYTSITKTIFVRDFISPFLDILALPIRSVNPSLYSQKEKQSLNNLVEIMKYYNINYTLQSGSNDSALHYVLNPNIDTLIQFKLFDNKSTKSNSNSYHIRLSNPQKQIISLAVIQKVTKKDDESKEDSNLNKNSTSTNKPINQISTFKVPSPPSTPKQPTPLPTHIPKDFFGNPIQLSPEVNKKNDKEITITKIKYKYQEGFTNAVKKSAFIKDFL